MVPAELQKAASEVLGDDVITPADDAITPAQRRKLKHARASVLLTPEKEKVPKPKRRAGPKAATKPNLKPIKLDGLAEDEVYDEEQVAKRKRDHGLFVAFAPVENPKIVIAVIVENGTHGSWVSPIARKVFDAYLLDQGMLDDDSPSNLIAEALPEGAAQ